MEAKNEANEVERLNNRHLEELGKIAQNYSPEEWAVTLAYAPLNMILDEVDFRMKSLTYGISIMRGTPGATVFGGMKEWN